MYDDIERAIRKLEDEDYTCVLYRDNNVYASNARGVAPILGYIKKGMNLIGFSAADKVVGKAAAMLFAYAGVSAVYGRVMSREAVKIFEEHSISYSYGVLTNTIMNRKGTGMCPMEDAVQNIRKLDKAYAAICERQEQLKKENINEKTWIRFHETSAVKRRRSDKL